MTIVNMTIVNTRADLDALALDDPAAHAAFVERLRATATRTQDVTVYPPGYGERDYDGPVLAPTWRTIEDLTTLDRFGFADMAELPEV